MQSNVEIIVVVAVVALACWYLARRYLFRAPGEPGQSPCGKSASCGCGSAKSLPKHFGERNA